MENATVPDCQRKACLFLALFFLAVGHVALAAASSRRRGGGGAEPRRAGGSGQGLAGSVLRGPRNVRKALRNGANVNATDTDAATGLILACLRQDWAVFASNRRLARMRCTQRANTRPQRWVRLLLDADPDSLAIGSVGCTCSCHSTTPLMFACARDDEEAMKIVTLLLDRGSDINAANFIGTTPLHCGSRTARAGGAASGSRS